VLNVKDSSFAESLSRGELSQTLVNYKNTESYVIQTEICTKSHINKAIEKLKLIKKSLQKRVYLMGVVVCFYEVY
jgi:hypothetical protein